MRILIGLALLSACKVEDRKHPVIPGGPLGPVGGITGDAAVADAGTPNDGGMLNGRVCVVTDLRDVKACASTGAGGLTVSLGTKLATTSANGAFSIAAPVASNLVWRVSGASIQASIAPFSAMSSIPLRTPEGVLRTPAEPGLSIPAIATADFQALEADYGVLKVPEQGSIVAHVVSASEPSAPVAMVTATTLPVGSYASLYDGKVARLWTQNSTGTLGAIWIPGLTIGSVALTIAPSGASPQTVPGVPIFDGAITFVTVEISL